MAMQQVHSKDGALGCACRRCGRENALFSAQAPAPVIGAFSFRCAACGADNAAETTEVKRVRTSALIEAA
jgi:ribosomal protein L37E